MMALLRTSTGWSRKPAGADRARARTSGRVLVCVSLVAAALPAAAPARELLAPERAFAFSARALDERTLEARFVIARGYYLYRDKIRFRVEPGALASAPALPAGQIKDDEFFGRVETFRSQLVVRLPLERPVPGERITLKAESQGCAEVGVCYPPQVQSITLAVPAPGQGVGPLVEAAPTGKTWFK